MNMINLSNYDYIRKIYEMVEVSEEHVRLLNSYNNYICGNKNFVYNKSYLDDSIDNFKLCLSTFANKVKFTKDFAENLSEKYDSLNNWIIIVEDVFMIDSNFKFSLLIDKITGSDGFSNTLMKSLEKFNVFYLNKEYIKFMYFNQIDNRDYTEFLEMKDSIRILNLVSKELKEKEYNE